MPSYAIRNYFAISENFPNHEVFLVVDHEDVLRRTMRLGIKSWPASRKENLLLNTRDAYRDGFWKKTTDRFFALQEFHAHHSDQSILHVEADVILFPNFPIYNIEKIEKSIAFPMSSPSIGLASTLFLKNVESTNSLASFTSQSLKENSKLNDTQILGLFKAKFEPEILVLRSGLDASRSYFQLGSQPLIGTPDRINAKGIFDASTFGIHLCGSDPRNSFGVSKVLDPLNHHFINSSTIEFKILDSKLYAISGVEIREIYTLHVHSKKLKYFGKDGINLIERNLSKGRMGMFRTFTLLGFFKCVTDYSSILVNKFRSLVEDDDNR